MTPFDEITREERASFSERIDGVVMTMASQLDELLLFKPKSFGVFGGNEILQGLELAARMGFENLPNSGHVIKQHDFAEKTHQIRQTLTEHYIGKVCEYHERITDDISPIIINNMQQSKSASWRVMGSKYRPALEIVFSEQLGQEFRTRRQELETRSRRFRDLVERIDKLRDDMANVVAHS